MVKKMLRGWQGPKAGRGVASRRWGGWTGRRVDGNREGGGVETGRGNLEGGQWGRRDGEGSNRDGKRLAMERGTR